MDTRALDNSLYSSPKAILGVAGPAVILNAAAPLTALVQTGLLGTYVGTSALGAYGAVSITAGFATRVFNFLVDGVSAKTGKSVGLRAWGLVAARVRMSLGFALVAGIAAAISLIFLIEPVSVYVLQLTPEVMAEAEFYWWLRIALIPILLLNMAISGILQGFRHVHATAIINTCQALAEIGGSVLVLRHNMQIAGFDGLFAMGLVTIFTQFLALLAGLTCMFCLAPPEAHEEYNLWNELFKFSGKLKKKQSGSLLSLEEQSGGGESSIRAPLLPPNGRGRSGNSNSNSNILRANGPHSTTNMECMDSMASTVYESNDNGNGNTNGHGGVASDGSVSVLFIDGSPRHDGNDATNDVVVNGDSHDEYHAMYEEAIEGEDESLLDFFKDGLAMLIRSMVLQITFFTTLVAASRLGTENLAAHSVVSQLWTCISYGVDGFAAAGIVLGSRLAAQSHDPSRAADAKHHLKLLIQRVLGAGLLSGVTAAVSFAIWRDGIIQLFTQDPAAQKILQGGIWVVLVTSQPINGLVFVYDGLMYSSQNFIFIRNYMILGFFVVFCPLLAVEIAVWQSLWGVWVANAAYNTWRAAGAAYLIHFIFMKEFDAQLRTPSRPASLQNIQEEEEEE
jgi:Na+-driven multidrug efflux pump